MQLSGSVLFFISSFFIRSFFIRSFFIISFFIRSFFIHYYFYTFIFYTVHFLYRSFFIWFIFYNSKFIFSKNLILLHFIVKLYKKNYSSTVGTGWHLLGNGSHVFKTHDQGYAYYGKVRLGHLFILGQVMGRMRQVMGCMCQVMGCMCQVMKKQSIKYDQAQEIFEKKSVARFFLTKNLEL